MNRKGAVKKPSYLDSGTNHSVNPAFFYRGKKIFVKNKDRLSAC